MKTERRAYQRNNFDSGINYTYYGTEYHIKAKAQNHSPGGLHFTSDLPVEPGSYISIQSEKKLPDLLRQEGQDGICAEVAWCNQQSDNYTYSVGVEYYEQT